MVHKLPSSKVTGVHHKQVMFLVQSMPFSYSSSSNRSNTVNLPAGFQVFNRFIKISNFLLKLNLPRLSFAKLFFSVSICLPIARPAGFHLVLYAVFLNVLLICNT